MCRQDIISATYTHIQNKTKINETTTIEWFESNHFNALWFSITKFKLFILTNFIQYILSFEVKRIKKKYEQNYDYCHYYYDY